MSEHEHEHEHHHNQEHWLENNWQFLVIAFGILFVTALVAFHPTI